MKERKDKAITRYILFPVILNPQFIHSDRGVCYGLFTGAGGLSKWKEFVLPYKKTRTEKRAFEKVFEVIS